MDPVTLGLVSRGVMGAGQMIGSLINKPGKRPVMTVPGQIKESTDRNRVLAQGSSDSILQNQESQIDQQAGNAASNVKRTATNASDVVGSLGEIQGNTNRAKQDASNSFAARKIQYGNQLDGALNREAAYEQQAFEYNKIAPFEEAVTANNQLRQAGMGNLSDAADMQSMYSAMKQPKLYNRQEAMARIPNINPFQ